MQDSAFYCKPAPGERIETTLQIAPDTSSAICGTVTDLDKNPLPGVLAVLFRIEDDHKPILLAQISTDADGQFAFGSLDGNTLYRIKVFQQGKNVRELELAPTD